MELELGLAISNIGPVLKELDLISYVNCDDIDKSTISCQSRVSNGDEEVEKDVFGYRNMKKRVFEFDEVESSKTLPLLLWDKDPNQPYRVPKRLCQSPSFTINKNEGDHIVGWPPIKSYRKKVCQQNDGQLHPLPCRQMAEAGGACGGFRSMYVKVQMEGFFITRKIDLKLYHSYHSLTSNLLTMFGKGQDDGGNYKLAYQNREGDWLLAGDVPWRAFIQSVQRLRLLRREG